ncbi:MAG: hypothetical protein ACJAZ1_001385 [Yoonia sp.]|jgi:hypothetical protein
MVVDKLDKLRKTSTSCQTIAFADLSTQMILVTDSQSTLPREALDTLCKQAASVLGVNGKVALGARPSRMALVAEDTSVRFFLRASDEPNDVLCCVCTPSVDLAKFVADATECLNRISNG